MAELLPDLAHTTVTLSENLRVWYERYLTELEAAPNKTPTERAADRVRLRPPPEAANCFPFNKIWSCKPVLLNVTGPCLPYG